MSVTISGIGAKSYVNSFQVLADIVKCIICVDHYENGNLNSTQEENMLRFIYDIITSSAHKEYSAVQASLPNGVILNRIYDGSSTSGEESYGGRWVPEYLSDCLKHLVDFKYFKPILRFQDGAVCLTRDDKSYEYEGILMPPAQVAHVIYKMIQEADTVKEFIEFLNTHAYDAATVAFIEEIKSAYYKSVGEES